MLSWQTSSVLQCVHNSRIIKTSAVVFPPNISTSSLNLYRIGWFERFPCANMWMFNIWDTRLSFSWFYSTPCRMRNFDQTFTDISEYPNSFPCHKLSVLRFHFFHSMVRELKVIHTDSDNEICSRFCHENSDFRCTIRVRLSKPADDREECYITIVIFVSYSAGHHYQHAESVDHAIVFCRSRDRCERSHLVELTWLSGICPETESPYWSLTQRVRRQCDILYLWVPGWVSTICAWIFSSCCLNHRYIRFGGVL